MASTRTKPEPEAGPQDEDQAAAAAAPDPEPQASAAPLVMEYLGEAPLTYLFDGAPPQTAERGDVCELPYDPGDGRWGPTRRKANRLPDNHPDEAAKRSRRQAEQRAQAHGWKPTEQAADAAGEA